MKKAPKSIEVGCMLFTFFVKRLVWNLLLQCGIYWQLCVKIPKVFFFYCLILHIKQKRLS